MRCRPTVAFSLAFALVAAAGSVHADGLPDIDAAKSANKCQIILERTGADVAYEKLDALRDCIGPSETAARYGGEEFAVIVPDTRLAAAAEMGERIREAVSQKQVVNRSRNQSLGTSTLSVGVAEYEPGEPLPILVQRADEALYAAKRQGRNRVVTAPPTR